MPGSVGARAEISELSAKNGDLYLRLAERSERGEPLGKAKSVIWKSRATGITSRFVEATGEGLKADIKILCLVQVRFDVLYGPDLVVEDVDPSFTLGDLAAKPARVRRGLVGEQIFGRNQTLAVPIEFLRVAAFRPEASAGLGDFRRETDSGVAPVRLRVLRRHLSGDGRTLIVEDGRQRGPGGLTTAPVRRPGDHPGGAVTDLAWLNGMESARMIRHAPIPVLAGIGHERDSTISTRLPTAGPRAVEGGSPPHGHHPRRCLGGPRRDQTASCEDAHA